MYTGAGYKKSCVQKEVVVAVFRCFSCCRCLSWPPSPPSPPVGTVGSLCQHLAKEGIIFVFVHVMDSNMSLQVVWSRILVLSIGTERTHVPRRIMDQTMPDHLVLALEAFPTFAPWTSLNRAVVRPGGRMHIRMRIEQVLRRKSGGGTSLELANKCAHGRIRHVIDAHAVCDRALSSGCRRKVSAWRFAVSAIIRTRPMGTRTTGTGIEVRAQHGQRIRRRRYAMTERIVRGDRWRCVTPMHTPHSRHSGRRRMGEVVAAVAYRDLLLRRAYLVEEMIYRWQGIMTAGLRPRRRTLNRR